MYRSSLAPPRTCALLLALGAGACGSSSGGSQADVDAGAAADSSVDVAALDAPIPSDAPLDGDAQASSDAAGNDAAGDSAIDAGGDASVSCLDASKYSALFTIADSAFCAVAVYTAPAGLGFQLPSWGSHGGPLTVSADATGGGVTLTRWRAPAGASGAMTSQTMDASTMIPTGAFLSAQAVDLPFFGWTVVSWTGPAPSTAGAFAMLSGAALVTSYTVNGPYSAGGVPAAASLGRFLYSGLSPLGQPGSSQNGLYAADACSSPSQELGAGTGCGVPALVAAWGETAGPVAVDSAQNVFAVLASSSAGTQEARGFLASSIARGAPPTSGTSLFTISGFPGSLAALAPTASAPGLLVLQPMDATTFHALDVIEQPFTTAGSLAPMGSSKKLLAVPTGNATGLGLMVDGAERLWVEATSASSTTYVVLTRTH